VATCARRLRRLTWWSVRLVSGWRRAGAPIPGRQILAVTVQAVWMHVSDGTSCQEHRGAAPQSGNGSTNKPANARRPRKRPRNSGRHEPVSARLSRGGGGGGGLHENGSVETMRRGSAFTRAISGTDTATGPSLRSAKEMSGNKQISCFAGRTRPKASATVGVRKCHERSPYPRAPGRRTEAVATAQLEEGSRTHRAVPGCRTVPTIVKDSDSRIVRSTPTTIFEA